MGNQPDQDCDGIRTARCVHRIADGRGDGLRDAAGPYAHSACGVAVDVCMGDLLQCVHCVEAAARASALCLWYCGCLLLTSGMYFYMLDPFGFNETFTIVYFIIGGSITLIAFVLFVVVTFFVEKKK